MRKTLLRCNTCNGALGRPSGPGTDTVQCSICGSITQRWCFPALYRVATGHTGVPVVEEGQSSCMNHPAKRAETVCDNCGKFLCALCDIDWNGEHLCTDCVQFRRDANHGGALKTEYLHYDTIAVIVAGVAMLGMFFGLGGIIALIVPYLAFRYWNTPWRPVPYWKWRMVAAVLLACLVFIAWLGFLVVAVLNL